MAGWRAFRMSQGWMLVAVLWMAAAGTASARTTCRPAAEPGVERCVSGLPAAAVSAIFQPQQASNWCWAASITMLLRSHGVVVPQEQVVRTVFGRLENERASASAMVDLLDRTWSDAAGNQGVASTQPLPPWRRDLGLAAPEVLDDLARDKPLLLGVQQHAMLLVQVTYERRTDGAPLTPAGVRLLNALVLDPASRNWLRALQPAERQPELLARVEVDVPPRALALAQPATLSR